MLTVAVQRTCRNASLGPSHARPCRYALRNAVVRRGLRSGQWPVRDGLARFARGADFASLRKHLQHIPHPAQSVSSRPPPQPHPCHYQHTQHTKIERTETLTLDINRIMQIIAVITDPVIPAW